MKTIMSVGQCGPDHRSIERFLTETFHCTVIPSESTDQALSELRKQRVDLVLVNRKLDSDYSDGTILIAKLKSEQALKDIPVMLISNYPEHQEAAVKLGATKGFGKLALGLEETRERVARALGLRFAAETRRV